MENIEIKNPHLKKQIYFQLNMRPDSFVSNERLLEIKDVTLDCETITGKLNPVYLEELDYFKNLTSLSLNNLKITAKDFNHILHLTKLTNISFNSCNLEDITNIGCLHALTSLSFINTFVKDFSPLSKITSLQRLELVNVLLINLEFLLNLPNITQLNLSALKCMDISALYKLKNIEILNLLDIKNINFDFLISFEKLKKISLSTDQLEGNQKIKEALLLHNVEIYKNTNIFINPDDLEDI